MRVGCYTLDLYCDNDKSFTEENDGKHDGIHSHNDFPHQFTGHTYSQCVKQARQKGWLIGKSRDLCPKCSGKKG